MSDAPEPVVIGLGGNVGTEAQIVERFRHAREALRPLAPFGPVRSAPLYRTAPVGPAQPAYLNTAVLVRIVDVQPDELIAIVLEIERLLGRDRHSELRWGPRLVDLDVLVWGARVIQTPALEVPHPRLAQRRFALDPLLALVGADFEVPGVGQVGELWRRLRALEPELEPGLLDDEQLVIEQLAETW